jgi:hypothetical protein
MITLVPFETNPLKEAEDDTIFHSNVGSIGCVYTERKRSISVLGFRYIKPIQVNRDIAGVNGYSILCRCAWGKHQTFPK